MTTTLPSPLGRWSPDQPCPTDRPILLIAAMKRASHLVKVHDVRMEEDPDRFFQVDASNWTTILEHYGEPIPDVITGYIDGEPVVNGATRTGARKRVGPAQQLARPVETEEGMVITCAGPCGQTQSVKKYPTIKGGGPANRGTVCRACEKQRRTERKAGR
jgi:hypothetical protein